MPDKIKKITALEILDSRGEPTLEVKIELANGIIGKAAVPSGASTGRFEAHELRDSDLNRYGGRGVLKAVDNVNNILDQKLKDLRVTDQEQIDNLMIEIDATKNKSKLGANTILGVSLAVAHTAAASAGMPLYQYLRKLYQPDNQQYKLPTPLVNIINGGKHGSTNINLQEFWIVPIKAKSFSEKIQQASNIFHTLGKLLHSVGYDTDLGNEGGYSPEVKSHHEVFDLITQAISMVSLKAGEDILLGIDAGASVFYNAKTENYVLDLEKQSFSSQELIDYYLDLIENYPLYFLEDPLHEEDWAAWHELTNDELIKEKEILVIGDDLFVTNISRLQKGITEKTANAIIIKPNQIGTLTETLATIRLAQDNNYKVIISHRSGDTSDDTIADLAVAVSADFIKSGSTAQGERVAKYNRLLNIEQELK